MGVDITFYKVKKDWYNTMLENNGLIRTGDALPTWDAYSSWQNMLDEMKPHEVVWFCGRHFIYEQVINNIGSDGLMYPDKKTMERIIQNARDLVSGWRMYTEELLQIPRELLEKILAETDGDLVTIPLESQSSWDSWADDSDYHQAKTLAEVADELLNVGDDEEIVVNFSY